MPSCRIVYPGNGINVAFENTTEAVLPRLEPIVLASGRVLMPLNDIPVGGKEAVDTEAIYEFSADAGIYAIGSMAYYDTATKTVNQDAENNSPIGIIVGKKTVGVDNFVEVHLNAGLAVLAVAVAE